MFTWLSYDMLFFFRMAAQCLMQDSSFWLNRHQVEEAENSYYARMHGAAAPSSQVGLNHTIRLLWLIFLLPNMGW